MKHSLVGAIGPPPAWRFSDMPSLLDSPLKSNVWDLVKACDVLIPDKASKRFLFSSPGSFVGGCTDRKSRTVSGLCSVYLRGGHVHADM